MKKFSHLLATLLLLIVFTSCSTDENVVLDNPNSQLLRSFEVKKDINGKYYLDLDLNEDTKVDKVFNSTTNTNQLHLFPSDAKTDRNLLENFELSNSELKIAIVDAKSSSKKPSSIIITDDNIALAKGNSKELTSYAVSGNEDGTYQLNFTVTDNVNVDFVYNDTIDTYEVHLQNGKNNGTTFSRNFEKEDGKMLRIDFVNHLKGNNAGKAELIRKPKIIIDDGDLF